MVVRVQATVFFTEAAVASELAGLAVVAVVAVAAGVEAEAEADRTVVECRNSDPDIEIAYRTLHEDNAPTYTA